MSVCLCIPVSDMHESPYMYVFLHGNICIYVDRHDLLYYVSMHV